MSADGSAYPDDWKMIANAVKAAAHWRCVRCGHPDGDRVHRIVLPAGTRPGPLYQPAELTFKACDDLCRHAEDFKLRMLTVHHLDGDKANCARWNLAALCQVCHLHIQSVWHPGQLLLIGSLYEEWLAPYEAGRTRAAVRSLMTRRERAS